MREVDCLALASITRHPADGFDEALDAGLPIITVIQIHPKPLRQPTRYCGKDPASFAKAFSKCWIPKVEPTWPPQP